MSFAHPQAFLLLYEGFRIQIGRKIKCAVSCVNRLGGTVVFASIVFSSMFDIVV